MCRVVSCRVASPSSLLPKLKFAPGARILILLPGPARTRAPGARAQPGPDEIAPRGRNFASYPLLVIVIYIYIYIYFFFFNIYIYIYKLRSGTYRPPSYLFPIYIIIYIYRATYIGPGHIYSLRAYLAPPHIYPIYIYIYLFRANVFGPWQLVTGT